MHVTKNNRPTYVVMSKDDYARLIERRRGFGKCWSSPRGELAQRRDMDAQLRSERESWGNSR